MAALTRDPRGQALVELALTLPVLLLCAGLIATLSIYGVARLAAEHAASEGARTLALTNDEDRARSAVLAALAPLRSERVGIHIAPSIAGERPRGVLVEVRVRYRVDAPLAFVGLQGLEVGGRSVRRMEYVP